MNNFKYFLKKEFNDFQKKKFFLNITHYNLFENKCSKFIKKNNYVIGFSLYDFSHITIVFNIY